MLQHLLCWSFYDAVHEGLHFDQCIHTINCDTGNSMGRLLKGHTDCINSVAISPDGKHIVSGGDDCTVRLWSSHAYSWEEAPSRPGLRYGFRGPEEVAGSIGEDGWIRTAENKLVLWVPTNYRSRVCDMSSMQENFSRSALQQQAASAMLTGPNASAACLGLVSLDHICSLISASCSAVAAVQSIHQLHAFIIQKKGLACNHGRWADSI